MAMRDGEREVVILMTDMVQYSRRSSGMRPEEIRDFLIAYHSKLQQLIDKEDFHPLEIEPSAGDGSLVIFEMVHDDDQPGVCTRALNAALNVAEAVGDGLLPPTRMGMVLGRIAEAQFGKRWAKFGGSFAVANRLEELCGFFGTQFLVGREIVRNQQGFSEYIVNIAKISLQSIQHPMNVFTVYRPGINNCPWDMGEADLDEFIWMKNEAMELFTGNQLLGLRPNYPRAREELLQAQRHFKDVTGKEDAGIERVLEYIRETPTPADDFEQRGMRLMEKKRDSLGERLYHLSRELLKAMNPDFFDALVVDTAWERFFKLEWCFQGDVIIEIGSVPDGIYYLDSGVAETLNAGGELLSTMEAGSVFGEMAYFGSEQRRTATVVAKSDVVLRKISTEDFRKLPVIIKIFERIAIGRRQEIEQMKKQKDSTTVQ